MRVFAPSDCETRDVEYRDAVVRVSNYLGVAEEIAEGPQAFLSDLSEAAGERIYPHFHDVDQFLVVVGGSAVFGRQRLEPIAFQYTDAFTTYGPITLGEDGMGLLTLRVGAATGTFGMPGSRDRLEGPRGRSIAIAAGGGDLPRSGDFERDELIPPHDDGLTAVRYRLASTSRTPCTTAKGSGKYILVTSGSLMIEGRELPAQSLLYVDHDDDAPVLVSGDEGADVFVFGFAAPTDRNGSNPTARQIDETMTYQQRNVGRDAAPFEP